MAKSAKTYESTKADKAMDAKGAKGAKAKGVPDAKADAKGSNLPGAVIGALAKAKRRGQP